MTDDQAPTLEYATQSRKPASRRGRGFLSVCAGLLLPGLGQFVAGFRRRGIVWFCICQGIGVFTMLAGGVPVLVPALTALIPLALLAQLLMLIDAYRTGRKSTREMLRWPAARYAIGIGLVALSSFVHPATFVAIWYRDHIVEAFVLPTQSMSPTINPRDRVLVHKRIACARWDLIAFDAPDALGQKYIKRIVGLPDEKVELVGDTIHINDKSVPLPHGLHPFESTPRFGPQTGCEGHPVTLANDEYYVLGDNSPISGDSRYWNATPGHQAGALPRSSIIGVATWTYWPPSRWRSLKP